MTVAYRSFSYDRTMMAMMVTLLTVILSHTPSITASSPYMSAPSLAFSDPDMEYTTPLHPCSTSCDHCPSHLVDTMHLNYYHPFTGEQTIIRRQQCPQNCDTEATNQLLCTGEGHTRACTCPPYDGCWRGSQCESCTPRFVTVFFEDVYCCENCLEATIHLTGSPWHSACKCMHPDADRIHNADGSTETHNAENGSEDSVEITDAPDVDSRDADNLSGNTDSDSIESVDSTSHLIAEESRINDDDELEPDGSLLDEQVNSTSSDGRNKDQSVGESSDKSDDTGEDADSSGDDSANDNADSNGDEQADDTDVEDESNEHDSAGDTGVIADHGDEDSADDTSESADSTSEEQADDTSDSADSSSEEQSDDTIGNANNTGEEKADDTSNSADRNGEEQADDTSDRADRSGEEQADYKSDGDADSSNMDSVDDNTVTVNYRTGDR